MSAAAAPVFSSPSGIGHSARLAVVQYRATDRALTVLRLHGFAASRDCAARLMHVAVAHYFGAVKGGRPRTAHYQAALAVIDRAEAFGFVLAHDQAAEIVDRVLEPYDAEFSSAPVGTRAAVTLILVDTHA